MTHYLLRHNTSVEIMPYEVSHAKSISEDLFESTPVNVVIQQRDTLLAPGLEEVFSVCCLYREAVIGVCTGVRKRWYGEKHRIEFVQVVVKEGFRGLGIAKCMMEEIAKHFHEYGVEILQISVEERNSGAINAYQKIGFERFGYLKRGLKHDDKYSNEIMLSMKIDDLLQD